MRSTNLNKFLSYLSHLPCRQLNDSKTSSTKNNRELALKSRMSWQKTYFFVHDNDTNLRETRAKKYLTLTFTHINT